MEKKKPTIAVIGHVDHGKTALSAATMAAIGTLTEAGHEVKVVGPEEAEEEFSGIRGLEPETYKIKDYTITNPRPIGEFIPPETRQERRKRQRDGKKNK